MNELSDAIANAAMLVTFRERKWSAKMSDEEASRELQALYGAKKKFWKGSLNLLEGYDTRLKAIHAHIASARGEHYRLTVPWTTSAGGGGANQRGPRLLPTNLWKDYTEMIGAARRDLKPLVDDFIAHYPQDRDAAIRDMGSRKPPLELYPSEQELRERFSLTVDFDPIPDGSRFGGLPEAVQRKLSEAYDRRTEKRLAGACAAVFAETAKRGKGLVAQLDRMIAAQDGFIRRTTWETFELEHARFATFRALNPDMFDEACDWWQKHVTGLYDPADLKDARQWPGIRDTADKAVTQLEVWIAQLEQAEGR